MFILMRKGAYVWDLIFMAVMSALMILYPRSGIIAKSKTLAMACIKNMLHEIHYFVVALFLCVMFFRPLSPGCVIFITINIGIIGTVVMEVRKIRRHELRVSRRKRTAVL